MHFLRTITWKVHTEPRFLSLPGYVNRLEWPSMARITSSSRVRGRIQAYVRDALRNGGFPATKCGQSQTAKDAYDALSPEVKTFLSPDDFLSSFMEWATIYRPRALAGVELSPGVALNFESSIENEIAGEFTEFLASLPRSTRLIARVRAIEFALSGSKFLGGGFGLVNLESDKWSTFMMVDAPGVPLLVSGRTTVQFALDKLKVWLAIETLRGHIHRHFSGVIDPFDVSSPVLVVSDVEARTPPFPASGHGEIEHFFRSLVVQPIAQGLLASSPPLDYAIPHVVMLFDSAIEKSAKPIMSACQWLIDGDTAQDRSTKLLNYCFGLEAILSESAGRRKSPQGVEVVEADAPTSMMVADRCAFLLGGTAEQREEIRKEVQALYGLRSKLVHGRSRRLTPEEGQHSFRARKYLGELITVLHGKLLDHHAAKAEKRGSFNNSFKS